jgi:hypothetical protein
MAMTKVITEQSALQWALMMAERELASPEMPRDISASERS